MNHNLLIVDDEYYVLTWLEEMFRVDFDMDIGVYTADSAYEALELLNKVNFDVVLTDINMPGMDGLELFKRIKGNWPHCKTVFLTGYRDFDNMYKIVNHKDVRYILKSEDDDVIMQAVREALQDFQKEMEQARQTRIQEQNWEKAKLWMRSEFLGRLISGEQLSPGEITAAIETLGLPVSFNEPFLVFLVRMEAGEDMDGFLLQEKLTALFEKNLPEDIRLVDYPVTKKQRLFFIQSQYSKDAHWNRIFAVSKGAMEYTQSGLRAGGESFSAIIESTPVTLQTLARQVETMKQMMIGLLGDESGIIFHAESVTAENGGKVMEPTLNRIPFMKTLMESRKRKEFFQLLTEYGEELQSRQSMHEPHAVEIYYSIAVMILEYININQLQEKIAFRIGLYKLTKLDEHASWQEAVKYLFDISDAVFQFLDKQGSSLSDHAMKRIVEYINSHLEEDLSLTRLAEIGGFNASYLSRLFKQTYQMNVQDYIFQQRIACAKELLADRNIMIQDVAIRTGYQSANSFARMFRKATGLSPAEYREFVSTGK